MRFGTDQVSESPSKSWLSCTSALKWSFKTNKKGVLVVLVVLVVILTWCAMAQTKLDAVDATGDL